MFEERLASRSDFRRFDLPQVARLVCGICGFNGGAAAPFHPGPTARQTSYRSLSVLKFIGGTIGIIFIIGLLVVIGLFALIF